MLMAAYPVKKNKCTPKTTSVPTPSNPIPNDFDEKNHLYGIQKNRHFQKPAAKQQQNCQEFIKFWEISIAKQKQNGQEFIKLFPPDMAPDEVEVEEVEQKPEKEQPPDKDRKPKLYNPRLKNKLIKLFVHSSRRFT